MWFSSEKQSDIKLLARFLWQLREYFRSLVLNRIPPVIGEVETYYGRFCVDVPPCYVRAAKWYAALKGFSVSAMAAGENTERNSESPGGTVRGALSPSNSPERRRKESRNMKPKKYIAEKLWIYAVPTSCTYSVWGTWSGKGDIFWGGPFPSYTQAWRHLEMVAKEYYRF